MLPCALQYGQVGVASGYTHNAQDIQRDQHKISAVCVTCHAIGGCPLALLVAKQTQLLIRVARHTG